MLRIRVVKTASGASAVQVVYYRNRKRVVFKYVGSASNSQELESLKLVAQDVINNYNPEIHLFEEDELRRNGFPKDNKSQQPQILAALTIIQNPSKGKKIKFVKTSWGNPELNQALIEKSKKLLGIKGYYTNLGEDLSRNKTIIERCHELYRVEQAFRISKHDLQTRPIFNFKEDPINLHILICFMALAVSKHIELTTGDSIRKFVTECKKITDARCLIRLPTRRPE